MEALPGIQQWPKPWAVGTPCCQLIASATQLGHSAHGLPLWGVCAGAPGPALWVRTGADGALPRGERAEAERTSRHTLSHTETRPTCTRACTHAHVHLHACACVHVCARVMTHALHQSLGHKSRTHSRRPGPGPRSHPHSGPGGSQAQPGSHALRCMGGQLESLGAARPGGQRHPRDIAPLPGHPLRGPCLDGSTASGQPPAPSLPLIARPPPSPERTPHLQQHPQAPPPRLPACHTPPVPTPAPPSVCLLGGHLAPPTCLWPAQPCHGDPRLQHGASDPQRQMEWTQRAGLGAPGTRSWKRGGWGGRGQLNGRAGTGMGVPESADRRGPTEAWSLGGPQGRPRREVGEGRSGFALDTRRVRG